jgi:hypothetical protein
LRPYFAILFFLITGQACNKQSALPDYSDYTHVVKRGRFELYIPPYLEPAKHLNNKAELQYSDSLHSVFALVFREEIPNLEKDSIAIALEEYFRFAKADILQSMKDARDRGDTISFINGYPAFSSELFGSYAGMDVYYRLSVLADEDYFYQIHFWTSRAQKAKLEGDFYASTISFKPL